MHLYLNADVGEYFSCDKDNQPIDISQQSELDESIIEAIGYANVACGYHAGDAYVMKRTIELAKKHQTKIGAHVSYPDIEGFGRRTMQIEKSHLAAMIHAQIAVLDGLAKCADLSLSHIKPHGALYNDMMVDDALFQTIIEASASWHKPIPLMIQALPDNEIHDNIAQKYGVKLIKEAFADRAYTPSGRLLSRSLPNSVLSHDQALFQARNIIEKKQVASTQGNPISIAADTICVHSDTSDAMSICYELAQMLAPKES